MIGQSAPTSEAARLAQRLAESEARIAELQRAVGISDDSKVDRSGDTMTGDLTVPNVTTDEEGQITNGQGEGVQFSQVGQFTKLIRTGQDYVTIDGDGVEIRRTGNGIRDDGGQQLITTAVASTEHWVIRGGSTTVTTNGSGKATIPFGCTFLSAPFVVTSLLVDTANQRVVHPYTISNTSFSVVLTVNDAPDANRGRIIQWIAFGRLA